MNHSVQSLSARLTIWFLLLAVTPLMVVVIFSRNNILEEFNNRIQEYLLFDAQMLAGQVSSVSEQDELQEIVESFKKEGMTFFILDQKGVYLAHMESMKTGQTGADDIPLPVLSTILSGNDDVIESADVIYAFARVPGSTQTAVIMQDKAVIDASLARSQRTSGIQLAASLFIVFIAGGFVIRATISKPMGQIIRVVKRMEEGQLDTRIDASQMDGELLWLAKSLNQMGPYLHDKISGLENEVQSLEITQVALRESEERHRNIFDGVRDAVLVEDMSGRILDANQAACKMYGLTKAEILEKNAFDLVLPEYQEAVKTLVYDRISPYRTIEAVNRRANGEHFIVELSPKIDHIGGDEVILIVARDITKRKRAENALYESERKLSTLLDNLMGMAYRCQNDENWTMEFVSEGCLDLTGYQPADLLYNQKIAYADIIHPDDLDMVWMEVQTALNEQRPFVIVYRILCQNSVEKWVMEKGQGIVEVNGDILAIEGFIIDITERKLFEEALKESEERYRLLFEKAGEGIILVNIEENKQFTIVSANIVAADMHGYSIDHLISMPINDLISMESRESAEAMMKNLKPGEWMSGTSIHIKSDQTKFPVEYTTGYIRLGRQGYLLLFYRDITEKELLQSQMIRSEKMANLGSLAAGIAHELNSPLQIITGISESLMKSVNNHESLDTARLLSNLEMINRNGWRCADIVHSLLTYARPAVEPMVPENLNDIIHDTLLLTQHQLASWSNITVSNDLAEDLPFIRCDRNKIAQVIINLLTNARDAMPEGGKIHIQTHYDEQQKQVILSISDTGCGIPADIKERIFDPFFTTKKIGKGTGLGLSIVLSIIRVHGGDITIDSKPHEGSTFAINLPDISVFNEKNDQYPAPYLGRYDDQIDNSDLLS